MGEPSKQNLETLESMVDSIGLYMTVLALEAVCHAKAEHIATNWQDAATAKTWTRAGNHLDQVATRVHNMGLIR